MENLMSDGPMQYQDTLFYLGSWYTMARDSRIACHIFTFQFSQFFDFRGQIRVSWLKSQTFTKIFEKCGWLDLAAYLNNPIRLQILLISRDSQISYIATFFISRDANISYVATYPQCPYPRYASRYPLIHKSCRFTIMSIHKSCHSSHLTWFAISSVATFPQCSDSPITWYANRYV